MDDTCTTVLLAGLDTAHAAQRSRLLVLDVSRLNRIPAEGGDSVDKRERLAAALGLDASSRRVLTYLARPQNVETAAFAKLAGVTGLGATPARTMLRFQLAKLLLNARFPELKHEFDRASPRDYRVNSLVNALIIGAAGGGFNTIAEAEVHMLREAFELKGRAKEDLADVILRAATAARRERHTPAPQKPAPPKPEPADFATSVRSLAKTMETRPFTGRVAISQVYDAGVARGIAFGTLEEFKKKLIESCRAGHLDLERCDIAGGLDVQLRDRSRTPFGRDERHFIVNRWI
jgi:hypothetical protein